MAAHGEAVLDVASRSLKEAIGGFDTHRIGSFVMACSTGYVNPGPDLLLAKELGLRSDLRRTFIGHMGCYAALNVIKVAMDSVAARPDELVICNTTELSSAHIRECLMPGEDPVEALITQALFGDASVSMLLGSAPDGAGIQFLRTHTEQLYDEHTMMSLNIGNRSFWMTLAAGVPAILQENIDGFLAKLLGPLGLSTDDIAHWGIHPGGPKIVRKLGKQLRLQPEQLRASWDVLANAGNCASATVLLVLENILRVDKPRPRRAWCPLDVRPRAHHRRGGASLLNAVRADRSARHSCAAANHRACAVCHGAYGGFRHTGGEKPVRGRLPGSERGIDACDELAGDQFNQGDTQLLITVSSDDGVHSGAAQPVGTDIVRQLHDSPYVAQVTSPWTAPPLASARWSARMARPA